MNVEGEWNDTNNKAEELRVKRVLGQLGRRQATERLSHGSETNITYVQMCGIVTNVFQVAGVVACNTEL